MNNNTKYQLQNAPSPTATSISEILQDFRPYQKICQYPKINQFIFSKFNRLGLQLRHALKILFELRIIIGWSNDQEIESPTVLSNGNIKYYIHKTFKDDIENAHELLCSIVATIMHLLHHENHQSRRPQSQPQPSNKNINTNTNPIVKSMETISLYLNPAMTSEDWHEVSHLYYQELLNS